MLTNALWHQLAQESGPYLNPDPDLALSGACSVFRPVDVRITPRLGLDDGPLIPLINGLFRRPDHGEAECRPIHTATAARTLSAAKLQSDIYLLT